MPKKYEHEMLRIVRAENGFVVYGSPDLDWGREGKKFVATGPSSLGTLIVKLVSIEEGDRK